jgi:hypothetical protein
MKTANTKGVSVVLRKYRISPSSQVEVALVVSGESEDGHEAAKRLQAQDPTNYYWNVECQIVDHADLAKMFEHKSN